MIYISAKCPLPLLSYGQTLILPAVVPLGTLPGRGSALVTTLQALFANGARRFLMYWGRRKVVDSATFVELMIQAGFQLTNPEHFVYLFTRDAVEEISTANSTLESEGAASP